MPPLVLLNCLPVDVNIEFVDSNECKQSILLTREEIRNIFDFNLQTEINLLIKIEGYTAYNLCLEVRREIITEKITLRIKDSAGRKLDILARLSNETAGFKVILYNANCLINNTGQNLLFFYREPSRDDVIYEADRDIMVSQPIESPSCLFASQMGQNNSSRGDEQKIESVVHMMSKTKEVFAKVEKSKDISTPIITFTHGSRSKFSLI